MLLVVKGDQSDEWWLTDYVTKRYLKTPDDAKLVARDIEVSGGIIAHRGDGGPYERPQSFVDQIPTVK